ncbi:MAG: lamin tail domain-containing protein [Roseibacillus sp.]
MEFPPHSSILSLTLSLLLLKASYAEVVISEFLTSNSGASIVDEDLEGSDWIEIHNTGSTSVSLLGYRLTDHSTDLAKWTFPDEPLAADGYLVVFASSKNRQVAGNELHTNFRLSAGGEYLSLLPPTGAALTTFDPSYPTQTEDISYGIGPDGVTFGYFTNPSPGSANTVSPSGQVADTQFSVKRGIFDAPIQLAITTATPGSLVRYTLDGSTPTATQGLVYSSPINITSTTTVKAAAFKTGFFPTNVDTQSYLFPSDIRTQYANGNAPSGWPSSNINGQVYDYGMDPDITSRYTAQEMEDALTAIPSVVLSTDVSNLTNASDGIYSNPQTRGLETPGHLEIIGGPEDLDISARCGLRIRGGASRNTSNPKHAFRAFFREEYGDSKLNFPLFGVEGVDEFDKIDFRTAQNYSWSKDGNINENTFLREVLARDLQAASGQPYTRSRYYHLYLNEVYWGLFMSQERAEANWGSSYLGGDDSEFDTLKSAGSTNSYRSEATDGDLNGDWKTLWDMVQAQRTSPTTARYNEMQGLDPSGQRDPTLPVLLDVDNLIDYMLVLAYSGSYDSALSDFVGAANNWYSVRNFVRDDRGFSSLIHDAEHSMGAGGRWNGNNDRINTTNGLNEWDDFEKSNPQVIHIRLAQTTPEYRERFADRAHAALFNDGYLTKDRVLEKLEARRAIVDSVIIAESARWGDAKRTEPADRENWENAVQSLINVFDTRSADLVGHLRLGTNHPPLYPLIDAPTFNPITSQVPLGTTIQVGANEGIIYFTTDGSDPRESDNNVNPSATAFDTGGTSTNGFGPNSTWQFDDSGTDRGSSSIVVGDSNYDSSNWKHPSFNDSSWSFGAGILGFGGLGRNGSQVPIATPMGENSGPGNSNPPTSYLRRSFTVSDTTDITSLTAKILGDDGYIVYLNGAEAYRRNMLAGDTQFDTYSITSVNNEAESTYNVIPLDPSLLITGSNLIAIELHQVNAGSSDLGFDMELSWASQRSIGIDINSPQTINARVLSDGEWSALASNYYSPGRSPEIGELLISEVHYHPANPALPGELAVSNDDGDFEFIELVNISSDLLELQDCALAEQVVNDHLEGVRFLFTEGQVMAPGERLVIVSNQEAFLARYPNTTQSIAGQFSGGLGNSGEWLRLINADGDILSSFRYNDTEPWPLEADGDGLSLQLTQLRGDVDYADPLSWMSITDNGSPGALGPGPFIGAANGDFDSDGASALFEYFSGTSDLDPSNMPDTQLEVTNSGTDTDVFYSFIRDPEAYGFNAILEHSLELTSWETLSAESQPFSRKALPNGILKETYLVNSDPQLLANDFFRLKVTLITP